MIREVELKYTAQTLTELSRRLWGDNSTEFLAGALVSVISERQLIVLINKLNQEIKDKEPQ